RQDGGGAAGRPQGATLQTRVAGEERRAVPPLLVTSAETESPPEAASLELVPRNCTPKAYTKTSVPEFKIAGDFLAYASPDSTSAVPRRTIDGTNSEPYIGSSAISADYL